MKHKRIIAPVMAVLLAIGLVVPALALAEQDTPVKSAEIVPGHERESRVKNVKDKLENVEERVTERAQAAQERVKNRQAELRKKLDTRKAETKERLQGQRLERCNSREQTINQLLTKSAENGQLHFERLQKYEQILRDFVAKQSLDTAKISTTQSAVNDSEADAKTTLATLREHTFECSSVNGKKPNGTIREVSKQRTDVLKAYRSDIKDFLQAVKNAYTDKEAA